jgi:hypothetical protein
MDTVPDLIDAFGGPTAFAKIIGLRSEQSSTASEMKRSGSIRVKYWPAIIQAARDRGLRGVNEAMLVRIHLTKKPRRAPRTRLGAA